MNLSKRNERVAQAPSVGMAVCLTNMAGLKVSEPVASMLAGASIRTRETA